MKIKKILALGMGAVMLMGGLAGCATPEVGMTQDEYNNAIADAKDTGAASVDVTADNADVVAGITADQVPDAITAQILADAATAQAEVDAEDEAEAEGVESEYVLDELEIGSVFNADLSDRQVESLFDDEVEFDGEDYDAEETLGFNGKVAVNEEDFDGIDYVQLDKEAISYTMTFDTELDTSLIDEDETLIFNLLGEEVEVVDWDVDKVTFTKGVEYFVSEGETITVGENTILVDVIADNKVMVKIGEAYDIIIEGETEEVGGVEIRVVEVLDDDDSIDRATLSIAEDVVYEIEDGDDYDEGEMYEYVITANSIGVTLNTEYIELDDDLKPLGKGEGICLPNNYICFMYDGLVEEDSTELSLELDTYDGNEYVEIDGTFINGLEDYDAIYVNATGIYDDDYELIGTSVEIDDSGLTLDLNAGNIEIDDIVIPLNLSLVSVGGNDISGFDEDYVTTYGIKISNPEDAVDDEDFTIVVPEEELVGEISIGPGM